MCDEYDFFKGVWGKFYNFNVKYNILVYLDFEVLDYFVEKVKIKGVELDVMLNELFKKDIVLIEGVKQFFYCVFILVFLKYL